MKNTRLGLAFAGAALLALAGCGGGDSTPAPAPAPATTDVSTTVIDGAIGNALVCLDKNGNNRCDADEPQARTGASGAATLVVANADVGKFPIVAIIGTDAVDADHGPVTTAYTLSAPADQSSVVSPLTTLVQQTVANTGASTADAAKSVQDSTGISVSLFQDYTKAAAPTDGSIDVATVARMLVIATQQQAATIASSVGATAVDGSAITQADLDKAVLQKMLELLPALVSALSDPAVAAATTPAAREAALLAAAQGVLADQGLTAAAMPVVVAVNNQPPVEAPPVAAGAQLTSLSFTDAANHFVRQITSSLVQNTPDSTGHTRYVDRRTRRVSGQIATWGVGSDPWRQSDVNWNGSAWVNCPLNFESLSTVRDAHGNSSYAYCDNRETGSSHRAVFDVAGKTMAEVYAQIRTAGYTNVTIADPAALGSATFPTGASVFYQTNTALTNAISYYPAGASNPAGTSNAVSQYSVGLAAGGTASAQPAGTGCNSDEATFGRTTITTSLEAMIASAPGKPCIYGPGSFVYNGVTYTSETNEWWGNSTVSIGQIGSAPVGTGPAPGFFTTNTLLRLSFAGSGANPVTYYACKQRFNNGSIRNCTAIGTGSYAIAQLGDARVMTFTNPPVQLAPLTYTRVFVERGGVIYYGYQAKPVVTNTARLNRIAADALLTQLGLTPADPELPLSLSAGSYQGTWDVRGSTDTNWLTSGTTLFINSSGAVSCQDRASSQFFACTLTITNPASGAFTFSGDGATASGNFDQLAGTVSGTYSDPTATPPTGTLVGYRR